MIGGIKTKQDRPLGHAHKADPLGPLAALGGDLLQPIDIGRPEGVGKAQITFVEYPHPQRLDRLAFSRGQVGGKFHRARFENAQRQGDNHAISGVNGLGGRDLDLGRRPINSADSLTQSNG